MSQIEALQCIRNISIYENRRYLYVVGQDLNHRQEDSSVSYYRILEIQRMNGSLDLNEDTSKVYTKDALTDFLKEQKVNILYDRVYALFGFIRLVESYYLIAITEAEQVANIHGHDIYSVKGSVMISVAYMPRRTVDESRYKGILTNNIDFASGYYFSFTYDLTNSIQNNLTSNLTGTSKSGVNKSNREGNEVDDAAAVERCVHDALFMSPYCSQEFYSDALASHRSKSTDTDSKPSSGKSPLSGGKSDLSRSFDTPENETGAMLGGEPREMYIWNRYALKPLLFLQESHRAYLNSTNGPDCPSRSASMDPQYSPQVSGKGTRQSGASSIKSAMSMDSHESGKSGAFAANVVNPHVMHTWLVPIIHGFISQKYAEFRGSKGNHSSLQSKESHALSVLIYTLIARRSSYFAGTRYLRRGTNRQGFVANDVESEQIITTCVEELTSDLGDGNGNSERTPQKKASLSHPYRPSHVIAHHPSFIYRSSSLVQYRGSIPMYWHHINLMSPHPAIEMEADEEDKLYNASSSSSSVGLDEGDKEAVKAKGDEVHKGKDKDGEEDEDDSNSTATLESEDDGEEGEGSGEIRSSRLRTIDPKTPRLYLPARRHFQRLQTTYGDHISVLNLVKQRHSAREVLVGGEFKAMIRTLFDESNVSQHILMQTSNNAQSSGKDLSEVMQLLSLRNSLQVIYRDFDLLHHEHYDDYDTEADIFEEIASIVNEFLPCSGYFVQRPVLDSGKGQDQGKSKVYSHPLSDSDVTALGVHRSYFDPKIDNAATLADNRQRQSSIASNRDSEDSEAMSSSVWRDTNIEDINTWMEGGTLSRGVQNTVCQNGIIRMNCVDCLDRTNIGQFVVAKQAMPMQCRSLGIDLTDSGLDEVLHMATEMWTKHGNELAIQYGGSGAMHALSMVSVNGADANDAETNGSNNGKNGKSVVEGVTSVMYKTTSSAVSSTASLLGFNKSSKSKSKEEVSVSKNTSDADGVEERLVSNTDNGKSDENRSDVAPRGTYDANTTNSTAINGVPGNSSQPHHHKFQMLGGFRNGLVAVNRYYNNVSTDYDKQSAIDLLLGEFVPQRKGLAVWELDNQPQYRRDGYSTMKRKVPTAAKSEKGKEKVSNNEGSQQNDSMLFSLASKLVGKGVLW